MTTEIFVYADFQWMKSPELMGSLYAQQSKGRKAFSFEYHPEWLKSNTSLLIDPDIQWFKGRQYPIEKENFGIIFDSIPDNWGKNLLKRKANWNAKMKMSLPKLYMKLTFCLV
jgi:serine/threonine-protein kinase HipA